MNTERIEALANRLADMASRFFKEATGNEILARGIAATLREFFAPPPGAVEVRIAVGWYEEDDEGGWGTAQAFNRSDDAEETWAEEVAFSDADTHRGIVTAWLPAVATTPEVEGSAEK